MSSAHTAKPLSDADIVALYFARDEQAIRRTDEKYGSFCHRMALHILHSEQDAEECVNDTWLRAWNAIPPKRPSPLRAFLLRITRNLSINRLRYNRGECRDQNLTVALEELEECIPLPEEHSPELAEILSAFLRTLPEQERLLFMGRYFHALPVEELARRLGLKSNTAAVKLHRTREALRAYLTERGYTV